MFYHFAEAMLSARYRHACSVRIVSKGTYLCSRRCPGVMLSLLSTIKSRKDDVDI